jgi:hypothetical protein
LLLSRALRFQRELKLSRPLIWLITQDLPATSVDDPLTDRFPCGIVMAYRPYRRNIICLSSVEVLAWVLPAYRGIGLGSSCFPKSLQQIEDTVGQFSKTIGPANGEVVLQVRYPASRIPAELDFNRAEWMKFFSAYDLKPASRGAPESELILAKPIVPSEVPEDESGRTSS